MRLFFLIGLVLLGAATLSAAILPSDAIAKKEKAYVCPPCGCPEDSRAVPDPGICQHCNMARVVKLEMQNEVATNVQRERLNVAILVFEGVQIIDYTAPYEVFGQANCQVATVAKKAGQVETNMGMRIVPEFHFGNLPKIDVLVIPGGGVDSVLNDPEAIDWVRNSAKQAKHVLSVCNGAYILAATGLLDGKTATTFYNLIDGLKLFAPKVKVISDQRYVDNGKFVTTAGLTSGMDGSLHMISKIHGAAYAQQVALNLEYDWKNDANYARANFADRFIRGPVVSGRFLPKLNAPDTAWAVEKAEGDANRFDLVWHVEGAPSPEALVAWFEAKVSADTSWRKKGSTQPRALSWILPEAGWQAGVEVASAGGGHRVSLSIKKDGHSRK